MEVDFDGAKLQNRNMFVSTILSIGDNGLNPADEIALQARALPLV